MSAKLLSIALFSVLLSSVAQLSLKVGSTRVFDSTSELGVGALAFFKAAALNPYIVTGFGLYGAGAVAWLMVLSRADLSVAYPFVSLGLVLTMAFGAFVLQEPVNTLRLMGALLIVLGVFLVAQS